MPMYFVQHGLSESEETDPHRPLTPEGREQVEAVARALKQVGVEVDQVCHSGKLRAKQTAEIIAEQIAAGATRMRKGMGPNDSVMHFAPTLEDDTMYVGHLPFLDQLLSFLVVGDEDACVLRFAHAAVVCLDDDDAECSIEWFLTPAMCNSLVELAV